MWWDEMWFLFIQEFWPKNREQLLKGGNQLERKVGRRKKRGSLGKGGAERLSLERETACKASVLAALKETLRTEDEGESLRRLEFGKEQGSQ
jgi:hypothetical protein